MNKFLKKIIIISIQISLVLSLNVLYSFADESSSDFSNERNGKENSWRYSNGEIIDTSIPRANFFSRSVSSSEAIASGIDVSEFQGKIDWAKVKAEGIKFAIIRCGYGMDLTNQDDSRWEYNVSECERLGIPYGVYLYSYADSTARASSEADHVLRLLEGHHPTYPVYYDMEESSLASTSNRTLLGDMATVFCNKISSAGYKTGIYANLNWWNNYLTDSRFDNSGWDKWVAQYYSLCEYEKDFHIWQYSSKGSVDGISGNVDMNYEYGAKPQPKVTSMKNGSATLSWDAIEGAEKYAIAVKTEDGYSTYTKDCTSTSYTIPNLVNGTTYQFLVQAFVNGKWTLYSNSDLLECTFIESPNVRVRETGDGTVTLEWDAVGGATKYAIAEYIDGNYKTYTLENTELTYTISDLANDYEHKFLVQANVNGKWSICSNSLLVSATPTGTIKPTVTATQNGTSVDLSWAKVPGATKYAIATKETNGYKTYTLGCTDNSYSVENLSYGTTYQFLVQAYINGKWSTFTSEDLVPVAMKDNTSPNVRVRETGDGTVTLEWDAVGGATKYAIAEYIDGNYKTYTLENTELTYTISDLANDYEHKFLVQANVNGKWSICSNSLLVSATPTGTIKPTVTATQNGTSVDLSWAKVPGATKYAIATKETNGYKTYTLGCTDNSYSVENLSYGTTYQFLVQAYINGKWSVFTSEDLVSATIS